LGRIVAYVKESIQVVKSLRAEVTRQVLRSQVRTRDFTIISNNCWGAHIYQKLGIEYQTPFIGLFLTPDAYLLLLSRLRWYLNSELTFCDTSRYEHINDFRDKMSAPYPIGYLGGAVEIHFLHYASELEAAEKWSRRVKRVSQDDSQLFVKFCDRDGCTYDQLMQFDRLPLQNKVCFSSKPLPTMRSAIWIPDSEGNSVPDGAKLSALSPKYFDAAAWINGTNGHPRWWAAPRCV
jgi:uncharacterized protein (DUF1919 family)